MRRQAIAPSGWAGGAAALVLLSLGWCARLRAEDKSPADSAGEGEKGTFTLDSEVSQLFTKKGNSGAEGVTVLRGNSKSG